MSYELLPRQRKLNGELQDEVDSMLKVKANKPLIQQYVLKQSGVRLKLKDLHNRTSKLKQKDCQSTGGPTLEQLVEEMKSIPGKNITYLHIFLHIAMIFIIPVILLCFYIPVILLCFYMQVPLMM